MHYDNDWIGFHALRSEKDNVRGRALNETIFSHAKCLDDSQMTMLSKIARDFVRYLWAVL